MRLTTLEREAAYFCQPHSYMNETYATMSCRHPRYFHIKAPRGVLINMCCACGVLTYSVLSEDDRLLALALVSAFQ